MDNLLTIQFKDIFLSHRVLVDRFRKLNERISILIGERGDLFLDIQIFFIKIDHLIKEEQKPTSERVKWKLSTETQHFKKKLKTSRREMRDLEIVIYDYRNQQQETWGKMNEVWDKQCEIWDKINLQKI